MSDELFPSGPWVGFYNYSGPKDRHRMDLHLDFAGGVMSGEGNDDVGAFVIKGRYDTATRECHWTKTYVGAHDVYYRGFREGKGIWGTWEIGHYSHGGFHIWPRDASEGMEQAEACSATEPADAIASEVLPVNPTVGVTGGSARPLDTCGAGRFERNRGLDPSQSNLGHPHARIGRSLLNPKVIPSLLRPGRGRASPNEDRHRRIVAQSCSLPFRRFVIGRASRCSRALVRPAGPAGFNPAIRQIANLRYADGRPVLTVLIKRCARGAGQNLFSVAKAL